MFQDNLTQYQGSKGHGATSDALWQKIDSPGHPSRQWYPHFLNHHLWTNRWQQSHNRTHLLYMIHAPRDASLTVSHDHPCLPLLPLTSVLIKNLTPFLPPCHSSHTSLIVSSTLSVPPVCAASSPTHNHLSRFATTLIPQTA
jgi:hypothetical protein